MIENLINFFNVDINIDFVELILSIELNNKDELLEKNIIVYFELLD